MNYKDILKVVSLYAPNVEKALTSCQFGSYGEYMGHVMSGNSSFHQVFDSSRLEAREFLFGVLAERFGDGPVQQLIVAPAIQTGSHNQFLIDRMTFNSYLSQIIGLSQLNLRHLIAFSASAISLTTSGRMGPAWLETETGSQPIIDVGRRYLDKGTVLSTEPVALLRSETFWSQQSPIVRVLDSCIDWQRTGRFADIVASANSTAIASMTRKNNIIPCIFDEQLVAKVLLKHLHDGTIVSDLLLDKETHTFIVDALRSNQFGDLGPFLLRTSPMLWHVDKHKLRAVSLVGERLESCGGNWSIPLEADPLKESISRGFILPGPFLTLCIIGLLPGISLIGGLRQIAYLPVFSRILEEALRRKRSSSQVKIEKDLNSWGMRVDDCPVQPSDIPIVGDYASVLDQIIEKRGCERLLDITNCFKVFRGHPFWKKVLQK